MATLTSAHTTWAEPQTQTNKLTILSKLTAFADAQKQYRTLWFLIALVFQGVFFLPLPAVLAFYYGAPVYLLAVTLTLFFANVIAGMGGSSIRSMLALFATSVVVHIVMVLIYLF